MDHLLTLFLKFFQDFAAHYNPRLDSSSSDISPRESCGFGQHCKCINLNRQCCCLFLFLCHGIWASSKYTLCWDLPNSSSRSLHCHMCSYLLDMWHHCHLFTPSYAEFCRPWWRVWSVCSRVLHSLGVCLLESSRNQRHATGSHHWVLLRRSKTGWGSQS